MFFGFIIQEAIHFFVVFPESDILINWKKRSKLWTLALFTTKALTSGQISHDNP